uniref:Frizzled-11 n=1 Tax=Hofstenia miamia TaxID=442651 RepID=A0A068CNH2_HOFMI|nr:frizzled-11 [Hofstenia miamia]
MLLTACLFFTAVQHTYSLLDERGKCQPITVPMCLNLGYNMTTMPNPFGQLTQEEAGLEVHQFWPLVEINCASELKFFLCSMYVPFCTEDYPNEIKPCRPICLRTRKGCEPIMKEYGFEWPERMNCDHFPPRQTSEVVCMDNPNVEKDAEKNEEKPTKPKPTDVPSKNGFDTIRNAFIPSLKFMDLSLCGCKCQPPFHAVPHMNISTGIVNHCASPCRSPYFSVEERKFATLWVSVWSIVCLISTTIISLTFLIDMQRFTYPERPIVFLSACYLFISAGFVISLIFGHERVACDSNIIRYSIDSHPGPCLIVFILIYYFSMASSIWWVILSMTWFLAAGMKWGSEAIANYSWWFHFVGWVLPCIQTVIVLFTKAVDGDALTGICYIGNQDRWNLFMFVITPLVVYLMIGTVFLLGGFISLFRIRHVIKQGGTKTDKLEKLMIRIGVFSVLYTVPATIVIACYFYEFRYRILWEVTFTCNESQCLQIVPDYTVFMLKYFMSLIVGITSGFWIWTGKTLHSWQSFFSRIFGGGKRREVQLKPLPMTHV